MDADTLSMGTNVPANVNMLSILFKLTLLVFFYWNITSRSLTSLSNISIAVLNDFSVKKSA